MTTRWDRIQDLFHRASVLEGLAREAFLVKACEGDDELLAEVRSLLNEDDGSDESNASPTNPNHPVAAAPAPPPARDPMLGITVERYTIKRVIGSGGMGVVYEAVQKSPRRIVALKMMKHGVTSKNALRRFEYEAQTLGRLRHEGIAQIFEAGTWDEGSGGQPWFALEYLPGAKPITQYCDEKKFGTRERLELFQKICAAVQHGHQKAIIHRDLKPGNILVTSSGVPKIIDFGVARSTDSDLAVTTQQTDVGALIGTLQYMSPEQCDADPNNIDIRSDVYALGVILYELLCGQLPYDIKRAAIHEAARIIKEEEPTKPSSIDKRLRGDIETITLKALEKDRDRRYQNTLAMEEDISRYLEGEPIAAKRPSAWDYMKRFARRHRSTAAAIVAVFVILVLSVVLVTSLLIKLEYKAEELENSNEYADWIATSSYEVRKSDNKQKNTLRQQLQRNQELRRLTAEALLDQSPFGSRPFDLEIQFGTTKRAPTNHPESGNTGARDPLDLPLQRIGDELSDPELGLRSSVNRGFLAVLHLAIRLQRGEQDLGGHMERIGHDLANAAIATALQVMSNSDEAKDLLPHSERAAIAVANLSKLSEIQSWLTGLAYGAGEDDIARILLDDTLRSIRFLAELQPKIGDFTRPMLAALEGTVWFPALNSSSRGDCQDFEAIPEGEIPANWCSGGGNSDFGVEEDGSDGGALRLFGSIGRCWGAVASHPVTLDSAYRDDFVVQFRVKNGIEPLSGCHPGRASLDMKSGCSWETDTRRLFGVESDGTLTTEIYHVVSDGTLSHELLSIGQAPLDTWYTVTIRYTRLDAESVQMQYWLDGVFLESIIGSARSHENDLTHLMWGAQEGTVWFDDICMLVHTFPAEAAGATRPQDEAAINSQHIAPDWRHYPGWEALFYSLQSGVPHDLRGVPAWSIAFNRINEWMSDATDLYGDPDPLVDFTRALQEHGSLLREQETSH